MCVTYARPPVWRVDIDGAYIVVAIECKKIYKIECGEGNIKMLFFYTQKLHAIFLLFLVYLYI